LALTLAAPAVAAPRDGEPGLLPRLIRIIKHLIRTPTDTSEISQPTP
jgi:hypothetical protein